MTMAAESPADDEDSPIQLSADWSQEWREGDATVALFRGSCRVVQGDQTYTANSMVVWAHQRGSSSDQRDHITVYLEDDVSIQSPAGSRSEQSLWVDLASSRGLSLSVKGRVADRPGKDDPLFRRAVDRPGNSSRTTLRPTQLTVPTETEVDPTWRTVPVGTNPRGLRRIRISPRSLSMPFSTESFESRKYDASRAGDVDHRRREHRRRRIGSRWTATGWAPIDLSADRAVIWTKPMEDGKPLSAMFQQGQDTALPSLPGGKYRHPPAISREYDGRIRT